MSTSSAKTFSGVVTSPLCSEVFQKTTLARLLHRKIETLLVA
jgi:hypothetical protein